MQRSSLHKATEGENLLSDLFALLAIGANAVEIEPVADDLVARLLGHLLHHVLAYAHLGVHDLPAADTNEVWVGIGFAAVIAVVAVAEAQLQHLVQVLEQVQRLVDGRRAGGWELGLELVIQLGGAGMPFASGQEAQQGDALRRQPVLLLPEPAYQCLEPGLWSHHSLATYCFQIRRRTTLYKEYITSGKIRQGWRSRCSALSLSGNSCWMARVLRCHHFVAFTNHWM